jgi:hypothetical protein
MAETSDELIRAILEDRIYRLQTHAQDAFIELATSREPIREGELMTKRQAFLWWLHRLFHETVIPEAVRFDPSMTREMLLEFVKQAWPGSRGPSRVADFDDGLILKAHTALCVEHSSEGWGCRAACETLADRLGVSVRTVKTHLSRARKNL